MTRCTTETLIVTGDVKDAFAVAERQALKEIGASLGVDLAADDLKQVERSEADGCLKITWCHERGPLREFVNQQSRGTAESRDTRAEQEADMATPRKKPAASTTRAAATPPARKRSGATTKKRPAAKGRKR